MSISAQIIADSVSPAGIRLTTFQLRYPRFIHAELMTHRVFSRNASSSRAIPVKKMIEELKNDPAMPVFWGSNKPGMQAGAEVDDVDNCRRLWLAARDQMITVAESFIEGFGLHKQIANRILEPWAHINVIVTATEWMNFYVLRRDSHAQPEIKALADLMWDLQVANKPTELQPGEWHLPYINDDDREDIEFYHMPLERELGDALDLAIKVSVARCARVSYLTFEGKASTIEEDLKLYDRLLGSQPLHASPAEHQATPDDHNETEKAMARAGGWKPDAWLHPHEHGNLRGWRQYRKMLPDEYVGDVDFPAS